MQYTVIALYADNMQRYGTCVEADDPDDAERLAHEEAEAPIIIAGIVEGEHRLVDLDPSTL